MTKNPAAFGARPPQEFGAKHKQPCMHCTHSSDRPMQLKLKTPHDPPRARVDLFVSLLIPVRRTRSRDFWRGAHGARTRAWIHAILVVATADPCLARRCSACACACVHALQAALAGLWCLGISSPPPDGGSKTTAEAEAWTH